MKLIRRCLLVLILVGLTASAINVGAQGGGEGLTIGFSQIGSESAWRTAFTNAVKAEAEARGIKLLLSDAQQEQENQIAAIEAWIAQGDVDAIILTPVVTSGWDVVLQEAQDVGIPVVIVDRNVDADPSLYGWFKQPLDSAKSWNCTARLVRRLLRIVLRASVKSLRFSAA